MHGYDLNNKVHCEQLPKVTVVRHSLCKRKEEEAFQAFQAFQAFHIHCVRGSISILIHH